MNESKEKKWRLSKTQVTWGITALLAICLGILFFFIVYRWKGVSSGLGAFWKTVQPFLVGAVLAWLIVPLYNVLERFFLPRLSTKHAKRGVGMTKVLATLVCVLVIIAIVWAMAAMIVPGLIQSISTLIANSQTYLEKVTGWGERFLENNPSISSLYNEYSTTIVNGVTDFARNTLLPRLTALIGTVSVQLFAIIRVLLNFIIGIVVCIYIMNAKRTLKGQSKRIVYSTLGVEKGNVFLETARFIDQVFFRFISGKLWDSLIIGVLCFICCSIMRMPYTLLISVIVGVTNIIPFFGPFIGAIPSGLLILVESPIKAVYFAIFILVLQQVDGNIIGPKILGDSVGLSPLWILFSILVFGGYFGFWGMVLGVPVFTCIYTLGRWLIRRALLKKGLPTESDEYYSVKRIDPENGTLEPFPPKERKRKGSSIFHKKEEAESGEKPAEAKEE